MACLHSSEEFGSTPCVAAAAPKVQGNAAPAARHTSSASIDEERELRGSVACDAVYESSGFGTSKRALPELADDRGALAQGCPVRLQVPSERRRQHHAVICRACSCRLTGGNESRWSRLHEWGSLPCWGSLP